MKSVAFPEHLQAFSVEYFKLNSDFFGVPVVALPIFPLCCDRKFAKYTVLILKWPCCCEDDDGIAKIDVTFLIQERRLLGITLLYSMK